MLDWDLLTTRGRTLSHPSAWHFSAKSLSAFLLLSFTISVGAIPVLADQQCTPLNQEIPIRSTLASAGFFANLRNASHSINFLMDELLSQAHDAADNRFNLEHGCVRSCAEPILAIVFDSVPNMTLSDYDENSACQRYFESTKKTPISYEKRSFASDQEAKDWYHELTQGEGIDGEDLYERCPGACSPSYSSLAYKKDGRFMVSTTILCGHARDKDDDQYRLSAALQWICP